MEGTQQSTFSRLKERWKAGILDRIRYSSIPQRVKALLLGVKSVGKDEISKLNLAADAMRIRLGYGGNVRIDSGIAKSLEGGGSPNIWFREQIGWEAILQKKSLGEDRTVNRSLILKLPQPNGEKGVLMVWFEGNIINLLKSSGIAEVLGSYHVIFASSWSPPTLQSIWPLVNFPGADFSLMLSNPKDADWFETLVPGAGVLPFYMSSWISSDDFRPAALEDRDIDLLMVANWAPFKRHWALFSALKKMAPDLRVVLVGQPDSGRSVDDIRRLSESFAVPQEIEFHDRLHVSEVNRLQERSLTSIILSKREGSCVVVAESMMAGCAAGLLQNAHIGSSAFINDQTGRFLDERNLDKDLTKLIEDARSGKFSPREWSNENIETRISNKHLNARLKERSLALGLPWTCDLTPFVCRGVPRYLNGEDREKFDAAYQQMDDEHGLKIALPVDQ